MINHLGRVNSIKQTILCGDYGRITIDTKLVEGLGGQLNLASRTPSVSGS
jgi:hypothetical protein